MKASHTLLTLMIGLFALIATPATAKDKSTCEVRLVKQGSIFLSFDFDPKDPKSENDCDRMQQPDTQVEVQGKLDPNAPQPTPR